MNIAQFTLTGDGERGDLVSTVEKQGTYTQLQLELTLLNERNRNMTQPRNTQ